MATCQPWECPDLKRIRLDHILPVVQRIEGIVSKEMGAASVGN